MSDTPKDFGETWGKFLGKSIANTEARILNYKKLVQEAAMAGEREWVSFYKSLQKDEEKNLRRKRKEKTYWNEDVWCWIWREPTEDNLVLDVPEK